MWDDEDLDMNDVDYFVQEYMNEINLMSLCRKNDVNFFLNARDGNLSDVKSNIHKYHPTKKEIVESIKRLSHEKDFENINLEDAVNTIFLHKIDEVTIKNSLNDIIIGMNKDNFMKKLYHYNKSYEDNQDVNHYKDPSYSYDIDKMTDVYNILKDYISLNLKSNVATFLEDYYQTPAGINFISTANSNAINGDGSLTNEDFHYFINIINKASLLDSFIKKEGDKLVYKIPEINQLGGFFVTAGNGLKVSLNIMDPTDRSGFNSRCFNNVIFAKFIYDEMIKNLSKCANDNNTTIEEYWETSFANNTDNKVECVDKILSRNHQYFTDVKYYDRHSPKNIEFQINGKFYYANEKFIKKYSKTLKELNKESTKNNSIQLTIKHITSLKSLEDKKIPDSIITKLNKISSNVTYMRAFLRPCYQKNQDLKRFHEYATEVFYLYDNVLVNRCFNSEIDQNRLNDVNHYNDIIKIILENFIIGDKNLIRKNIESLSKQEVYNIVKYLEIFVFRSHEDPVKTLSKRLKVVDIKVDIKYFVNCIDSNFMHSDHDGIVRDINFSLRVLQDKLENYEQVKIENRLSKVVKILLPVVTSFNENKTRLFELKNLTSSFVENNEYAGSALNDEQLNLIKEFNQLIEIIKQEKQKIDKYMPRFLELEATLEKIKDDKKAAKNDDIENN